MSYGEPYGRIYEAFLLASGTVEGIRFAAEEQGWEVLKVLAAEAKRLFTDVLIDRRPEDAKRAFKVICAIVLLAEDTLVGSLAANVFERIRPAIEGNVEAQGSENV